MGPEYDNIVPVKQQAGNFLTHALAKNVHKHAALMTLMVMNRCFFLARALIKFSRALQ